MKQIVFFASGSGTNFQSVIDAIQAGHIHAKISGLITNKTGIRAISRAKKNNIPVEILAPSSFSSSAAYDHQLLEILGQWQPDLIVLAGYMLKIPTFVINAYQGRIINIHPSLLPKFGGKGFYGMKVHSAVLENDEKETGCTVHIVTKKYDQGPVLAQKKVPVLDSDTPEILGNRVLEQEHKLLPKVIKNFISNSN